MKKTNKSHPRQMAVLKFLEQMEETKVDTEDSESAELQHFWKILLRGMEVKIPFSGKDKRDSESADGVLHIFWLDGTTLYLRKEKVHFSQQSAMTAAMSRVGTISIPLAEMRDVTFGGAGVGGLLDDEEDEDELNASPCLNKYVRLVADNKSMEIEVTQRAAEMLIDKFNLVIKAIDMFEKIEAALQKAQQNEVPPS
jgi:hypothetical protein